MAHLKLETLARLVDEAPDADETAHLESCDVCRADLEAMRHDVRSLSLLPDVTPAPDAWDALEMRLAAEGIVRTPRTGRSAMPLLRIAAVLTVFVGGTVAGRMTATPETIVMQVPAPAPDGAAPAEDRRLAADRTDDATASGGEAPVERPLPQAPSRSSNVTLASAAPAPQYAVPRNMDEAAALLRETEELYLGALTRYAELASQAEAGDPVARLAALTSIVMTTQAALNQAPTDPVINGYHLTALAQRDATLRQVAAATSDRWH